MDSAPLKPSLCIEVCVDSVESAIASVSPLNHTVTLSGRPANVTLFRAVEGGASRLELCGNLGLAGGTTPSVGLLRLIKKILPHTQVMVMIRPRIGDFVYTELELETMIEDIKSFEQEKVTGFVLGVLRSNGTVDIARTSKLVEVAKPLQVCFHRAFDLTRDPIEAFKDVASIGGITRILTSGHGHSAPENLETLSRIASLALTLRPRITILPGSGINVQTISAIANCDWWKEFREVHLSAGQWIPGSMEFRKEGMNMGVGGIGEWGIWRTNSEVVRKVEQIAQDLLENVQSNK